MTVVLGVVDGGRAYMASDSGVWDDKDNFLYTAADPKVLRFGGALVGFAGDVDKGLALFAELRATEAGHVLDDIGAVIDALELGSDDDLDVLVAAPHVGLFSYLPNGTRHRIAGPVAMIGQGEMALGAWWALGAVPGETARLAHALEVQVQRGSFCRPPVWVRTSP